MINPSKLLPSSKKSSALVTTDKKENSALVIREKRSNLASSIKPINIKVNTTALSKEVLSKDSDKNQDVGGKLVKIEKFLQSDLIVSKKKAEEKRKEKEKQDFEEAEKKLETPKIKGFNLPKISLPKIGFFERVKRFLFFTALGWLLPKIIEFLPKLQGIAKIIGGVYKFAEGMFGHLFNGFMSLVKFGGDLKNKTIGFIAQAKASVGGDYDTEFKKLENQFNTFANVAIIAGVLGTDIGLAAVDEYNKWNKLNKGTDKGGYAAGYAAGLSSRGGLRYRPQGQAAAGRTLQENVSRQRLTRERMLAPSGPRGPIDRVSRGIKGSAAQLQTGTLFGGKGAGIQKAVYNLPGKIKNIGKIPDTWGKKLSKLKASTFGKLAAPFAKFLSVAAPFAGAAVGAIDAKARFESGDKVGGWIASTSAALDAFAGGAGLVAAGALATVFGSAAAPFAAGAAAIATGISIGLDVLLLVRDILNVFGVKTFSKGGRIVNTYQGGGTTRGGRPVGGPARRTITPTRIKKPLKIKPPKTKPGKDVGGEQKIREFYGKEIKPTDPEYYQRPPGGWIASFGQKRMNEKPFKALTSTSKILKEIPLVGGLMGAAVDIALGQKPDSKVYNSLSHGIGYLIDSIANQKASASLSNLTKEINKFVDGGYVPPSRNINTSPTNINSGEMLAKVLGPTIDQRVNEAIQSIEKELKLRKEEKDKKVGPNIKEPGTIFDGGGGGGAGGYAEGEQNFVSSKEIYDYLKSKGVSHNHAMGMLANIQAESSFNAGAIGDSGTSGGLFQHHAERFEGMKAFAGKDWAKNWKRQVDYALREGAGKQYLSKEFKSAEEASAWFTLNFERPSNKEQKARERLDNLKNFNRDGSWKGSQPSSKMSGSYLENLNKKLPGITLEAQKYRASRDGGEREHAGRDYDLSDNDVFYSRLGGEVIFAGNIGGGYGNVVDIYNKDLDRTERIAEGTTILPGISKGTIISPGQAVVRGTHQTGVIHYEIRRGRAGSSGSVIGTEDPDAFLKSSTYNQYISKIKKSKEKSSPSEQPPRQTERLPGQPGEKVIRSFKVGDFTYTEREGGKYTENGKPISKSIFDAVVKNHPSSLKGKQGGGLIAPSKPNRPIPNSFASYENYGQGMMIAIQPIIIEKEVPMSSGGRNMISFPVPVAVNSNMNNLSLHRG